MMQPFAGGAAAWDALIASLPGAHLLQTWEWAQVKAAYGWQPMPFVWKDRAGRAVAAAMVLRRQVTGRGFNARLCLLYAPKGPLFDHSDALLAERLLTDLQSLARHEGAILLKIDPDVCLGTGIPGAPTARETPEGAGFITELQARGWEFSNGQVQFRNTVWVDLDATEDELLARMKQKTRYNVRLAEKKGVSVRTGTPDDLAMLYRMYAGTSVRDRFVIRDEDYYLRVWSGFMQTPQAVDRPFAEPLIAVVDGQPVAAIFVFYFAGRAYYLHGMSADAHREKMPNYLLQWEAMKRARARGCRVYDLWGAPDDFRDKDPLSGVFRFKEGLGGSVVRTMGAWDYPARPFWYAVYTRVIPRVLDVMRWRGRRQTERALE